MFPAARLGDLHACPTHGGGPIVTPCCPQVLIEFMPAARLTDLCICAGAPCDAIVRASTTVMTGGLFQARLSDQTAHGGVIITGAVTVIIG